MKSPAHELVAHLRDLFGDPAAGRRIDLPDVRTAITVYARCDNCRPRPGIDGRSRAVLLGAYTTWPPPSQHWYWQKARPAVGAPRGPWDGRLLPGLPTTTGDLLSSKLRAGEITPVAYLRGLAAAMKRLDDPGVELVTVASTLSLETSAPSSSAPTLPSTIECYRCHKSRFLDPRRLRAKVTRLVSSGERVDELMI